jgi:hypothetical protein
MPLTEYQAEVALLLAANRSPDSHLAGGAALHITPDSLRYSNDLDYFNDSAERVATAFHADQECLQNEKHLVAVEISQPGYIRAIVSKAQGTTKVEWAQDTAWRFLPSIQDPLCGYRLHPVDLSVNKLLALVGRDEPRDFLDIIHIHRMILPLGALCWAAAGKDPGYTPLSLLEMLKRRGRYRPEDFSRLQLAQPVDLISMKEEWLQMLKDAEIFVNSRPPEELGCLYLSPSTQKFYAPEAGSRQGYITHFGRISGVLPQVVVET